MINYRKYYDGRESKVLGKEEVIVSNEPDGHVVNSFKYQIQKHILDTGKKSLNDKQNGHIQKYIRTLEQLSHLTSLCGRLHLEGMETRIIRLSSINLPCPDV